MPEWYEEQIKERLCPVKLPAATVRSWYEATRKRARRARVTGRAFIAVRLFFNFVQEMFGKSEGHLFR